MLFNSYIFWVFFVIVISLYVKLPHKGQNRLLLVASYIFYGFWDWRFLSLIFVSTVIDYFVANKIVTIDNKKHKKHILIISLVANLGILGFFKYFNFFIHEFETFVGIIGFSTSLPSLNIILPVGISFYTFQTLTILLMSIAVKQSRPKVFLILHSMSVFSQLVAGPIERSYQLMPQILNPRKVNYDDFVEGSYHVLMGLFKKVIIADNMAPIVNMVFAQNSSDLSGAEVLVGVYAFAFQIYGDFSGYSSIAQGIAKWMGFNLMWNFKMPYLAISPSDFWNRWHISLSSWLRDYLYIPLGGNRGGRYNMYRNLMFTMVLGGLWHGAGWTFINWGIFHGLLLIGYRIYENRKRVRQRKSKFKGAQTLKMVLMFHFICISWLLFRAESMTQVWDMLVQLTTNFHFTEFTGYAVGMIAFFAGPLLILEYLIDKSDDLLYVIHDNWSLRGGIYSYILMMMLVFSPLINQEFIYFQF